MKKIFILSVISICVFMLSTVYSVSVQNELSKNLTRLHIIANSNTALDQSVKYRVRDEVLDYVKTQKTLPTTTELESVTSGFLSKIGVPYTASATLENCYVPKKDYKSISLPQGRYNCIKITLGKGEGENWWCVAYPPLCYTESMFGDLSEDGILELEKILSGEIMSVIKNGTDINFRFKIVDEIQRLINHYT